VLVIPDARTRPDPAPLILRWVPTAEVDRVLAGVDDRLLRTRAFAAVCRINTLYMIMCAGSGHLGSSFSAADLVAHVLLNEMREPFTGHGDVYFSSKGHDAPGLYAALIGLRALPDDLLHRLRRLDGLPGHPDIRTPHMPFNTGSLGMGVSKAKGLILGDRLSGRRRRVFVTVGDGELQEGQVWESLAGAVRHRMSELTVIVDHNKLQSDTWIRDVSDLGDLVAKFTAFGWGALRCDGNDASAIDDGFARRWHDYPDTPVVIVADTVKGAGCAAVAATSMPDGEWRYRFHSGAPSAEDYTSAHAELVQHANATLHDAGLGDLDLADGLPPPHRPASAASLPAVYGLTLRDRANVDARIVALDADLIYDTGLAPFMETHPKRLVECGIAEQDMVSIAGGLAAAGMLPFVHSFSCFLHARPNEQIYNNASENHPVIYVGALAGLVPAAPGHSHQAVREVGAVGSIPGLVVLEPVNGAEVEAAVDYCLAAAESVYLRLVSAPVPERCTDIPAAPLRRGHGRVVSGSGRTTAIGAGPLVVGQLLAAANVLAESGLDLRVVNLPWLNAVDPDWLQIVVAESDRLIVVENHYTAGGQADAIARALLESGRDPLPAFHGIGLTDLPACGTPDEALRAHGLDAAGLAEAIRIFISAPRAAAQVGERASNPEGVRSRSEKGTDGHNT
jgi:transketolase